MKTLADVLRERGKLGPYTAPASEAPPEPAADPIDITPDPGESEPIERPRRRRQPLPPVDF